MSITDSVAVTLFWLMVYLVERLLTNRRGKWVQKEYAQVEKEVITVSNSKENNSAFLIDEESFSKTAISSVEEVQKTVKDIYETIAKLYYSVGFINGSVIYGKVVFKFDTVGLSREVRPWNSVRFNDHTVLDEHGSLTMSFGNMELLEGFLNYFDSENVLEKVLVDVVKKNKANLRVKQTAEEVSIKLNTFKRITKDIYDSSI